MSISSIGVVHGTDLRVRLRAPSGVALRCALRRQTSSGRYAGAYRRCGKTVVYRSIHRGRYVFSVHSTHGNVSRAFRIT